MGAGAGTGTGTGAGTGGGQNAAPSQDGTQTGSIPEAMRGMMGQQFQNASRMGSQIDSGTGNSPLASFGGLGSAVGGGVSPANIFIDQGSSTPPPGFNPQQSAPPMGFRNLSAMMGGGFNPTMGGGGRFFSPVDQGPPQPFNTNQATPLQYQAASYPQGNLANQLASGYQQVFGRAADPSGMDYWASKLRGQNLSQGEVNRYLLGGARNEDIAGGSDYSMSLTGGRPSLFDTSKPLTDSAGKPILDSSGKPQYEYTRQYRQPIYSPTYSNYAMNRGFYSPGYGMGFGGGFGRGFGGGYGGGYNPFSYMYAEGGNVYADDNNEEDQGIAGLLNR